MRFLTRTFLKLGHPLLQIVDLSERVTESWGAAWPLLPVSWISITKAGGHPSRPWFVHMNNIYTDSANGKWISLRWMTSQIDFLLFCLLTKPRLWTERRKILKESYKLNYIKSHRDDLLSRCNVICGLSSHLALSHHSLFFRHRSRARVA